MKKSLVITFGGAFLVVLAAAATLAVLVAWGGQESAMRDCLKLKPAAARAVTAPDYGKHLARLARCTP